VGDILDTLLSFSPLKADIKIEVDPDRLRPIDADLQVPNTAKFEAHTGWKPEIPYQKTLRDLLDYWRERVSAEGNRFLTR
jgi:GDPmannose 4,6-dehydratase